ncbi:MAG: hypothetical protein DHS20C11_27340 [Lysobacteraceae bacterium]|nr:MAG: hypothetical protein DHS20C11_27340 [Xanthomonadaceae bacterium]
MTVRYLRSFVTATLAMVLWFPIASSGVELAGTDFPEYVRVEGASRPFKLSGAGILSRNYVSNFVGALYLPRGEINTDELIAGLHPLRLDLVSRMPNKDAEQIDTYWRDAFDDAVDDAGISRRISDKLSKFVALFDGLDQGDRIEILYHPDSGATISRNGLKLGSTAGIEFNRSLLALFLGAHTPVNSFRDALLADN